LLVNALLLVILVPKYGLSGAALAATSGYGASTILLLMEFKKLSRFSIWDVMVIRWTDVKLLKNIVTKKRLLVEV
jgi:O-antigen/teichoic acid export membrane protein